MVAGPSGASTCVNHGAWCTVRPRRPTLPRAHIVSMAHGNVVPQRSFRDPNESRQKRLPSRRQSSRSSQSLFDLGLSGPEGDAATARAFAESLLIRVAPGQDRRDARLLLTAVCLHLQGRNGPDATVSDLVEWLGARDRRDVLAKLHGGPLSLTDYAVNELGSLSEAQQSAAFELACTAAQLALAAVS